MIGAAVAVLVVHFGDGLEQAPGLCDLDGRRQGLDRRIADAEASKLALGVSRAQVEDAS